MNNKNMNVNGVLKLKDTLGFEYYVYNKELVESYDVSGFLNQIINKDLENRIIRIIIKDTKTCKKLFNYIGELNIQTDEYGHDCYFVDNENLEETLFNNTETNVNIEIYQINREDNK